MCKSVHRALFIIAEMWRQPKCPCAGEQINQLWYFHTAEHFLQKKYQHPQNTDDSNKYYVKQWESDTKEYIMYGYIYMKFSSVQSLSRVQLFATP